MNEAHPSSRLVEHLLHAGELAANTPLAEAFRAVDRGAFVPAFAVPDHTGQGVRYRLVDRSVPGQRAEWASHVYTDETLIIEIKGESVTAALVEGTGTGRWTSSSTMPSLMARHLGELDLDTHSHILEIGVGSGYNTAILCELLGEDRVTSIDISPGLVTSAGQRLAGQGYQPTLAECDGHQGYPEGGPYDRIISTTAFTHVPPAWLEQVTDGGTILVNIAGGTGGAMLRLQVRDGVAEGRFLSQWAGFMPARSHNPPRRISVDDEGEHSQTSLDPSVVRDDPAMGFLAQLATIDANTVTIQAEDGTELLAMDGADGAWTEVELKPVSGRYTVVQGGPRRLWSLVEKAYRWWEEQGHPDWSAFGATVTHDRQLVWFDSLSSAHSWELSAP